MFCGKRVVWEGLGRVLGGAVGGLVELHVEEDVRLRGHDVRERAAFHARVVTMDPRLCNGNTNTY